jgi:hypothetical protein
MTIMEDNSKEIEEIQNLLKFYEKLGESNKFIVAYINELNKRLDFLTKPEENIEETNQ